MPGQHSSSPHGSRKASRTSRAARTDAPRDAAVEALLHQVERFPDMDLAPPRLGSLTGRDAAFVHAIYDATIRRWLTLSYVLGRKLRQPFETQKPGVKAVLLAGAAQLLLLDKVPPHAAINHSVEWAKQRLSGSLAGMVNGVLRNVARLLLTQQVDHGGEIWHQPVRREKWSNGRDELPLSDGRALLFKFDFLPEDEWERLTIVTSVPSLLVQRWRAKFGDEVAREQMVHTLATPPTLLNAAYAKAAPSPEVVEVVTPHEQMGHLVWGGSRPDLVSLLSTRRDVWVQDPSSALAVSDAASLRDEIRDSIIVDLCAGQGTKTRQLAATFPDARIFATDIDEARLQTLRDATKHLSNVRVVALHEVASIVEADARLVLADVPCSNSGVIARRPEAACRWSIEQLERLSKIQQGIIREAVNLLAKGSVLAYSTCSIDAEECEDQARWAATEFGLTLLHERRMLPAGKPGDEPRQYRDGAYCSLLRK